MTDIVFINDYYKGVIDRLKVAGFTINRLFLVRSEPELVTDIKSIPFGEYFLCVVIPSSDTKAFSIDNIKEVEPWLISLLEKTDRKGITSESRLTSVALQQQIISQIKSLMRADVLDRTIPCNIRPDFNSMHTDPEDNFVGCEGYSLSFKVESDDFLTTNL